MNREIKFRGQRVDNKEWIEGDLVHDYWIGGEKFLKYAIRYKIGNLYSFPIEVIPDTIGQFTELHDKKDVEEELKICTGCGHKSTEPINPHALACCPDDNYVPLDEYIKGSVYQPFIQRDNPMNAIQYMNQHEPSKVQIARVEVAEQILYRLLESRTVAAGNPIGMVEFAYQCADELIKQSKQQP